MSAYTELLKTRGVARIIAAQLTARFPFGMLSLALLLHIQSVYDSYAIAGLVLAATSVGQAIAGPLTSRWMGIWGMRRVLTLTLSVCAVAIAVMATVDLPIPLFMVVGFLAGLSMPPIQPAVRTIYPKMVNSRQLTPLFSLDASAQEIIWVVGPVLTTVVATQISTVLALWVVIVFLVGGGIWFIASPEVGQVRIPRSPRRFGVVLRKPSVIIGTAVGFLLVGSCAAIEAGVVATYRDDGAEAGIVLSIWAVGSLIGGLSFGSLPLAPWSLARRMAIVTVGLTAASFALGNVWWLAAVLFVSGAGIAPALAMIFAITSATVRFSDTAEAYGWIGTGQLIGAALGSAFAGVLIDSSGAIGAYWVAGSFALLGALLAAVSVRWIPDLRGREAGPIPDTEPVAIQPS